MKIGVDLIRADCKLKLENNLSNDRIFKILYHNLHKEYLEKMKEKKIEK